MTDSADEIGERSMKMWDDLGQWMARRPLQMLGIVVGLVLTIVLIYSAFQTSSNDTDITRIQEALCADPSGPEGDALRDTNCQKLLGQLLKNPTPEQAERLREIVKDTP